MQSTSLEELPEAPLHVCVLAQNALPVVDKRSKSHFGGLETSAWLTAKGLAQFAQCEVTLLVLSARKQKTRQIDKVNVCTCWSPVELIRKSLEGKLQVTPQFPFLHILRWNNSLLWKIPFLAVVRPFKRNPRPPKIVKALTKLPLDAVCLFGVDSVAADAILQLKSSLVKTFLFVQSNASLLKEFASDPSFTDQYGETGKDCQYALKHATHVVTQTAYQQHILKERFGVDSHVHGNPFDLEEWDSRTNDVAHGLIPLQRYMLWIGRPDHFHKRPLKFLELARACPDIDFLMILNHGSVEVREEVEQTCPTNVTIIDHVPYENMPSVFKNCVAFVTTSSQKYEGLPNVILQASATGKPVLGLDYAPEEFVAAKAAVVAGSISALAEEIRRVWNDADYANRIGRNGRDYLSTHGSLSEYSTRIANMLRHTRSTVER